MLGVTSYQEALRALGTEYSPRSKRRLPMLRLVEQPERARLELTLNNGRPRSISAAELQDLVLASRARRGAAGATSALSDVLRSVGLALDELHALAISLDLQDQTLSVRFATRDQQPHELVYAGEELEALRRAAAARRKGDPLRRVLILHADAERAAPIRELLVAEFAVQSLPTVYARAVAQAGEPPDAVLAQTGCRPEATLEAVHVLRSAPRTAGVPIVLITAPETTIDPAAAFAAGVDDLLPAPFQPAQLRARLRTWLLRGSREA